MSLQKNLKMAQDIGEALHKMGADIMERQQQYPGGIISPASVGPLLLPPSVTLDPSQVRAQFPIPVSVPPSQPYQESPAGARLQQQLTPTGSAVYAGIQGLSKFLNEWQQRREAKERAEAANLAQNLMDAYWRNQQNRALAIVDDKRNQKILKKVFPGWLTPVKQQKQQKPPDAHVQGFQEGVQQSAAGAQGQAQAQAPATIGPYYAPQALPKEVLEQLQAQAELQAAQQDPSRLLPISEREALEVETKLAELGMDAAQQKEVFRGSWEVLRAGILANAALDRALKVENLRAEHQKDLEEVRQKNRKEIKNLEFNYDKELNRLIAESKSPRDLSIRILTSQIGNLRSIRNNLISAWSKLVAGGKGNTDEAKALEMQIDAVDRAMEERNMKLDDIRAGGPSGYGSYWKYLGVNESPEEEEEESEDEQ